MRTPDISCVLPVYNGETFLASAIESVLAQTRTDFELIVVDDGSRDRSADIANTYAASDARVRVFSKANGGIVEALNFGLQRCAGKYIARMDADDLCLPDRFALQADYLDANADAVAVGGAVQRMDEAGNLLDVLVQRPVERLSLAVFPPRVPTLVHPAAMIRAETMTTIGGYRGAFPHAEDYDLYVRLAEHGRLHNLEALVLHYRIHGHSVSANHLERQEQSAALAEISAYARQAGKPDPGDDPQPLDVAEYARRLAPMFSARLVDQYIAFRIWRRYSGSHSPIPPHYWTRMLVIVASLRPSDLMSIRQLQLRVRIGLAVLRYATWRMTGRTPMRAPRQQTEPRLRKTPARRATR